MQGIPDSSQIGNHNISGGRSLSHIESSTLVDAVQAWSHGVDERQRGFFLARKSWCGPHGVGETTHGSNRISPLTPTETEPPVDPGFSWMIAPLSAYEDGFFNAVPFENCYVCFADPSNYAHAPGWMLRNLLVLVKRRWGLDRIQVLRYRDTQPKHDNGRNIVITLASESQGDEYGPMPKVTGWERNPAGKLAGRMVNLTEYLDPKRYSHL